MYCTECGTVINKDESFCTKCGKKTREDKKVEDRQQNEAVDVAEVEVEESTDSVPTNGVGQSDKGEKKKSNKLLIVAGVVVVAIIAVSAILFFSQQESQEQNDYVDMNNSPVVGVWEGNTGIESADLEGHLDSIGLTQRDSLHAVLPNGFLITIHSIDGDDWTRDIVKMDTLLQVAEDIALLKKDDSIPNEYTSHSDNPASRGTAEISGFFITVSQIRFTYEGGNIYRANNPFENEGSLWSNEQYGGRITTEEGSTTKIFSLRTSDFGREMAEALSEALGVEPSGYGPDTYDVFVRISGTDPRFALFETDYFAGSSNLTTSDMPTLSDEELIGMEMPEGHPETDTGGNVAALTENNFTRYSYGFRNFGGMEIRLGYVGYDVASPFRVYAAIQFISKTEFEIYRIDVESGMWLSALGSNDREVLIGTGTVNATDDFVQFNYYLIENEHIIDIYRPLGGLISSGMQYEYMVMAEYDYGNWGQLLIWNSSETKERIFDIYFAID